ncbi:MAG: hypothetical protein JEY91_10180 [Spirochaetaceae bacterium]|nr:hypothetical protein [Spirochaetaceae bacterium]
MKKILMIFVLFNIYLFVSCAQALVYEEVTTEEAAVIMDLVDIAAYIQGVDPEGNIYTFSNFDLTQINASDPLVESYLLLNGTISTSDGGNTIFYDLTITGGPVFTLECTVDLVNGVYIVFIANGYDMKNSMNEHS